MFPFWLFVLIAVVCVCELLLAISRKHIPSTKDRAVSREKPAAPCRSFVPAPAPKPSGSLSFVLAEPVKVSPSVRYVVSAPAPAPAPPVPAVQPRASVSCPEEKRAARLARSQPRLQKGKVEFARSSHFTDAVSAKSAISKGVVDGSKAKSVKRVRFGEVTVITVSRWIVQSEHVFVPGADEDGEM